MPSILNEIGSFQLGNLVFNRIPFILVNLGTDLSGLYLSIYQNFLEAHSVSTTPENALSEVASRAPAKEIPIVLVDETGETTGALVDVFEAQGYLNVFHLNGGSRALRADLTPGR